MESQSTGSKGVVGDAASLMVLGGCLQRLLLYHIDQTYKALRGPFFALANRNHICFGYLRHRSQCCNTSTGDAMPMSEADYAPILEIPNRLWNREKNAFTVEEALRGALEVTTKCRGSPDIVCLRLRKYMCEDDAILSADNHLVERRLDAVRKTVDIAQSARESHRLQVLVEGDNVAMHGDLQAALGVIDAEAETVRQQRDHVVMNWCRDRGWFTLEENEWKVLAMIHRGLIVDSSGTFLTCVHHKTQLHGFDLCRNHFTVTKNCHLHDNPCLNELADNIKSGRFDETDDGASVLRSYFGRS
jgi:hypothetical protein